MKQMEGKERRKGNPVREVYIYKTGRKGESGYRTDGKGFSAASASYGEYICCI